MGHRSFSVRYWVVVLVLLIGWAGLAFLVAPAVIEDAYNQESLAFLNEIISGRRQHPLDSYLASWAGVARRLTFVLLFGSLVAFLVIVFREPLGTFGRRLVYGRTEVQTGRLTVLALALALGLLAGLTEAGWVLAKNWNAPNWEDHTSAVGWMAPLGAAMVFVALALVLLTVMEFWRRLRNLRFLTFVFVFLTIYAVARSLQIGVHPWASGILALGVGAHMAGYATRRPLAVESLARRSVLWLILIVVAIAVGSQGHGWLREKRALSSLGAAPDDSRNVLLIILDTVRGHNLSLYGYPRMTTPNLDRLTSSAVVFDRAVATSPWTLPSHGSMFTGRFHHEMSADWTSPLERDVPTLAEYLGSHGYESAGFVGNYYYCGRRSGLGRGFTHYDDDPVSLSALVSNSWLAREIVYYFRARAGNQQALARRTAEEINQRFLAWLDDREQRPFFAFLNYYDAHDPYLPPEPFNTRFATAQPLYYSWPRREYTADDLEQLIAAYDGTIAYIDEQLGILLRELDRRGVLTNTAVIITSDHGEQFGEKEVGLVLHGNSLYLTALQVPLLILDARADREGARVPHEVSIRDIPATVVDLMDLTGPHPFPGRSLRQYWDSTGAERASDRGVLAEVTQPPYWTRWDPVRAGPMQSLIDGPFHYIRNGDGAEELYDIVNDPWERSDIGKLAASTAILGQFRAALDALIADSATIIAGRLPNDPQ